MTDWTAWNEIVEAGNRFDTPNKNARPSAITKPTHIVIHITGNNNFDSVHNGFMNANDQRSAHYLVKKDGALVQYAKDSERAWHAGIKSFVQNRYDTGTLSWKKYLRYFSWYTGYPADAKYLKADLTPAATPADRALVARADDSDWPAYNYWGTRHGTRIQPINYDVSKDPNNYSIGIELLSVGSTNPSDYEEGLYKGLLTLLADLCAKYDIPVDAAHIIGHEDVNPVERWGWDPNSGFDWDRTRSFSSKKYSLPIDLGFSTDVTLDTIKKCLTHIEKDKRGGYYPIGANTVWHGGVHLKPKNDSDVFAVLPGKIIAARLPADKDLAFKDYGSRNFILIEHTYKEKTLFSLYMHLANLPLSASNETIKKVKWINKGDLEANLNALKTGDVVKLDCSVAAGDLLWRSSEYGSGSFRTKLLHFGMFSETNIVDALVASAAPALEGNTGWAALAAADKKLRVEGARADRKEAFVGDTVVFDVAKVNYKDAPSAEQNKINWKVTSADGTFSKVENQKGPKLQFQVPGEVSGKVIKAQPYMSSPSNSVVAEVTISTMTKIDWLVVEDNDNNYNVDNATITSLFPKEMWEDENITMSELIEFYRDNKNGSATKLRFAVCKFVDEWGIPDLDAAVKALKNRGFWLPNPKRDIEPYLFWKEARDKGIGLPASPHVWHYHPLILLGLIASLDVGSIDSPIDLP